MCSSDLNNMKGTVKEINFKKDYNGTNIFGVKLEGEEKEVQFWSKANPPSEFKVGDILEGYTVTETEKNGFKNYTLKLKKAFGGGFAPNPAKLEFEKKNAALGHAISLVNSGKIQFDNLRGAYEKFVKEYL